MTWYKRRALWILKHCCSVVCFRVLWLLFHWQGVEYLTFFVDGIEGELLFVGTNHSKSCGPIAPTCAICWLYRTWESCCRVDPIVNLVTFFLDILKVVYMTTAIYRHIGMSLKHGQKIFLHVGTFFFRLGSLCIDGMMTHTNHPIFVCSSQRAVQPCQLLFKVCLLYTSDAADE